jgi:Metallo-beta-lactamase superfamily
MVAEPATWDVYVMEYARSKDQPWVNLISGMYNEGVMDLPFSFIFAQRGEDRVLIDTGFMQDEHSSGFSRKFGIPTWISPLRMLAEIGVHADAINAIFVTHAHFDHMGSVAEFPLAHLYIQKSELLSWYEAFALPKRFSHLTLRGKTLVERGRHLRGDNAVGSIVGIHHVVSGRMSEVRDKFAGFVEGPKEMSFLVLNREGGRIVRDHAKAALGVSEACFGEVPRRAGFDPVGVERLARKKDGQVRALVAIRAQSFVLCVVIAVRPFRSDIDRVNQSGIRSS